MGLSLQKVKQRSIVVTIPANTQLDVQTNPLSDFRASRYLIEYRSDAQQRFKTIEMVASRKDDDVTDSIYGRLGDVMNVDTNILKSGSDVVLRVANNEAFDVKASVTQLSV